MHVGYFDYDDWNGLYVDGKLVAEGHSWHITDTFRPLIKADNVITQFEIVYGNLDEFDELEAWGYKLPETWQEIVDHPGYEKSNKEVIQ